MTDVPSAAEPRVTVVVPCFNASETLPQLLEAMSHQVLAHELFIVDNGSSDGTAALATGRATRVITEKRAGAAWARNSGLAACRTPYYVTTDADCWPASETWLNNLVAALDASEESVAAVAGVIEPAPDEDWWSQRADVTPARGHGSGQVTYAAGPNGCYRTDRLREVGGFPTDVSPDDAAIGGRLRKAGYKILPVDDACVYHRNPRGLRGYFRQMRKVGRYSRAIDGAPIALTEATRIVLGSVRRHWRQPREIEAAVAKSVAYFLGSRA